MPARVRAIQPTTTAARLAVERFDGEPVGESDALALLVEAGFLAAQAAARGPAAVSEQLRGGGLTRVMREGEAVRRAAGPWTPAVHALLRHLEARGFEGAPRVVGVDGETEILTYVRGDAHADHSDAALAAAASLLRSYHDAVADFEPPADAQWQFLVGAPRTGDVVCHNDVAPANTIYRGGRPHAFVDWDLAAPAPRIWDVAHAVYRFVPLYRDPARLGLPAGPRAPRIRLFCDAYGLDDRTDVLPTVALRIRALYETAREWGGRGVAGWADVWRDTRGEQWLDSLRYVEEHRGAWERELRA